MNREELYFDTFESPLGKLILAVDTDGRLLNICFSMRQCFSRDFSLNPAHGKCDELKKQLDEYFACKRKQFTVELCQRGTPFQKRVWEALLKIPYGELKSYAEVAEMIDNPRAARAVGNAVGANPIAIVVPCHRVIKSSGKIGGYGGGIEKKIFLLRLEGGLSTDDLYQK